MKRHVFIGFLCFLINFQIKGQCNALFSDSTAAVPCGVVQFTNLSTGTNSMTNYSWTFPGAITPTSNLASPTATYNANGIYTVCLSIFNASPTCSSSICQTLSINCFTTVCTANFNFSPCIANGQISFNNTSPGTNSTTIFDWDFGDANSSSATSPTHTYAANGIYTVCLTYTTYAPAYCTASICKTVNISCACAASFNTLCVQSGSNAQVSFTNTSFGTNGTTQYLWSFGGSAPTSTNQNPPPVTYTANGTYSVCLSINTPSPPCYDTICTVITVSCISTPTSGPCQANFTNTPCNNGQMSFYSTSTGTNGSTTYTWTNSPPPSGPPAPYTATVCLKISNTSPVCTHSVCKTILVDCTIGVPEFIFDNTNIKIFPNPGNGLFNLDLSHSNLSSSYQVRVYNILGELVHQSNEEIDQNNLNTQIDLQNLPNGAYFLRLNSGSSVYSVKLIISK